MTHSSQETASNSDVVIIGAGPVGLFGIFACGMLGLKTYVIDALPEIGGQCTALYPEKPIYDIPAYPSIKAGELVTALAAQAAPFNPIYDLGTAVTQITNDRNDGFLVTSSNGKQTSTRAILIAAGAGAFGPNRPPIEEIESYENKSVFYTVRNPSRFDKKTIVIAGGGDSAIDWANVLAERTKKIYLIHRRDTFRAAPESLRQMENHIAAGRIEKIVPYQLTNVSGQNGQITHVHLTNLDEQPRDIAADALLCFYGLSTSLGVLAHMNLNVVGNQIITNPTTAATSLKGIYAAGDIAAYPHKRKLIMTGFAEMAQAAQAIYAHIHPSQPLHHEHSTSKGIPHTTKT